MASLVTTTIAGNLTVPSLSSGDTHTKLLIHSDTHDGSTTFTDASGSGHTVTTTGDPTHETEQKKFGTSSLYFDGNDELHIADHADWNLGSGDFTIECWVKTSSSNVGILNQSNGSAASNSSFIIWLGGDGKPGIYLTKDTGWDGNNISTTVVNDNNWHHLAAIRYGNSLRMYVDGVSSSSTTLSSFTVPDSSRVFDVGSILCLTKLQIDNARHLRNHQVC